MSLVAGFSLRKMLLPLAFGGGLVVPKGPSLVAEVLLFALVPTVIANICFFRAMRHIVPGVVAMIMTAEVALLELDKGRPDPKLRRALMHMLT